MRLKLLYLHCDKAYLILDITGIHEQSLHSVFIEKLCKQLSWTNTVSCANVEVSQEYSNSSIIDSTVAKLSAQGNVNPLLLANLKALFATTKPLITTDDMG